MSKMSPMPRHPLPSNPAIARIDALRSAASQSYQAIDGLGPVARAACFHDLAQSAIKMGEAYVAVIAARFAAVNPGEVAPTLLRLGEVVASRGTTIQCAVFVLENHDAVPNPRLVYALASRPDCASVCSQVLAAYPLSALAAPRTAGRRELAAIARSLSN